jgi:2-oxoglutarate ferredoxin oxidoreductase subunit beta
VFRAVLKPTYDEMVDAQVRTAIEQQGPGDLKKLLNSGDTWTVKASS